MNLENLGQWLLEHPRAARGLGLGLVALGTVSYLRLLRNFAEFDYLLRRQASDAAQAASEALGG